MPEAITPISFHAVWHPDILSLKPEENTSWEYSKKVAYLVISVAIPVIGFLRILNWMFCYYAKSNVIPSCRLTEKTKQAMGRDFQQFWNSPPFSDLFTRHTLHLTTADGVKLRGTFFHHKHSNTHTPTVLLFQPNAVPRCYTSWWKYLPEYSVQNHLSCNFLTFDYRETGESEGMIEHMEHMILDGDAAMQFARDHLHISPAKLVVYGYSIGGLTSANVLARHHWFHSHRAARYINDRSLESVRNLVSSHLPYSGFIVSRLAAWNGWNLDAVEACRSMGGLRKLILIHPEDKVILREASFAEGLRRLAFLSAQDRVVEVGSPVYGNEHSTPIDYCYRMSDQTRRPVDEVTNFIFQQQLVF